MEEKYVDLSPVDRQILDSYALMIDSLGDYLGGCYEIVLHSLENLDHSVIKIINGHYTGRKEGFPITDVALKMLGQLQQDPNHKASPYFTKNKYGANLRSCTIPIHGESGRIIGLICMNFHMESPLSQILEDLVPPAEDTLDVERSSENFTENIDEIIYAALAETKEAVYANSSISLVNKNKEIVLQLYQKGIFNIKDAVIKVAERLDISKNTVYMHIRNGKNRNQSENP